MPSHYARTRTMGRSTQSNDQVLSIKFCPIRIRIKFGERKRGLSGWVGGLKTSYYHACGLCAVRSPSARTILRTRLKRKWLSSKPAIARFLVEKAADSESLRKETWIYTGLAWIIDVGERMQEFYSGETTQFINTLWH